MNPAAIGKTMKTIRRSLVPGAALIILATSVVYLPALQNGFVFDDLGITSNPIIPASDGLRRIWFTTEAPDYYPLTWSMWWLQWRWWGADPLGYHVVNVLWHAINAVLAWAVLRRLKIPGAWFSGLIFAIHPINVATAAWISEQKNTLSMLFYLVAILLYLRFDEERGSLSSDHGSQWYGLSLAAFLLALLSKNAVVMLPVVLLGCLWWRHGRVQWRDVLRSAPFFALSLVFGLVNIWFEHDQGTGEHMARSVGFLTRLAAAGWVPWFYLYKTLLPVHLTVIYPLWDVNPARWISYAPATVLVACFALFWWKRHTWGRPPLFGFGYFVVTLFPVLGFVDQGFYRFSLVADHWQYYSIIGVIALAVATGEPLFRRPGVPQAGRGEPTPVRGALVPLGSGLTSVAVVAVLGAASWMRVSVYRSEETLWSDNVAKNPAAWAAQYNLGLALWQAGKLDDAIRHYRQALRLKPDYDEAHNNLGLALAAAGRPDEAMAEYRETVRLRPGNAEAHVNLGAALVRLGQPEQAIDHFREAVRLKPGLAIAHFNLASALQKSGRTAEAAVQYAEGLRLDPNQAAAHNNLGILLVRQGRIEEAIHQFESACRLDPNYAEPHYNLGSVLLRMGRRTDAKGHFEQALRVKPDYADAQRALSRLQTDQ